MRKLFFLLPALLLLACGNTEPTNNPQQQAETPKALQDDNSSDLKIYSGRSENIVDQLYNELVDKSKVLQKLEEDLVNLNDNIRDKKNIFDAYDSKSTSYYNTALSNADRITDSTLKKQMRVVLINSEKAYRTKVAGLNGLVALLDKENISINDHHSVLKIMATLPQIEQYQKDKLPKNSNLVNLLKEQEKVKNDIVKNTPAF
jgi:hypothetical protein